MSELGFPTARLNLKPLTPDHASDLFLALSDPLVYEHLDCDPPESVEWLADEFSRIINFPPPHPYLRLLHFAVHHNASHRWIGRIEALVATEWAEVAFLFGSDWWGHGYGHESLQWLHRHLKENYGVEEFWAATASENVRSKRLLLRSGYSLTFLIYQRPLATNKPGDSVFQLKQMIPGQTEALPS